jgi:hypothetical protein
MAQEHDFKRLLKAASRYWRFNELPLLKKSKFRSVHEIRIGNRYGQPPALPTISWGSLIRGGSCVQCIKITRISTLQPSLTGTALPDGSTVSAEAYFILPSLTTYDTVPINSLWTRTVSNVRGSEWLRDNWCSIPDRGRHQCPDGIWHLLSPGTRTGRRVSLFIMSNYLYGLFNPLKPIGYYMYRPL